MFNQEETRRAFRTAAIVGAAVIASLLVYLIIVEILRIRLRPFHGFFSSPELSTIRYIFYGFAVMEVIIIRILQTLLLKRAPNDDAKTALHKIMRTAIATVCLSEVPALLGLALFLIGGLNKDFYALFVVSLVLIFMYFPRLRSWEEWLGRNR